MLGLLAEMPPVNEGQGVPVCRRNLHSVLGKEGCRPTFFFFLLYFWLYLVFIVTCGICLVVASGGYSPISELGLLIEVASLIAEHSL